MSVTRTDSRGLSDVVDGIECIVLEDRGSFNQEAERGETGGRKVLWRTRGVFEHMDRSASRRLR